MNRYKRVVLRKNTNTQIIAHNFDTLEEMYQNIEGKKILYAGKSISPTNSIIKSWVKEQLSNNFYYDYKTNVSIVDFSGQIYKKSFITAAEKNYVIIEEKKVNLLENIHI